MEVAGEEARVRCVVGLGLLTAVVRGNLGVVEEAGVVLLMGMSLLLPPLRGRRLGRRCCSRGCSFRRTKEEEVVEALVSGSVRWAVLVLLLVAVEEVPGVVTALMRVEAAEVVPGFLGVAEGLMEQLKKVCGSLVVEVVSCLLEAEDLS
jgi:hypothetical protein